jgi:hypothetical protein
MTTKPGLTKQGTPCHATPTATAHHCGYSDSNSGVGAELLADVLIQPP